MRDQALWTWHILAGVVVLVFLGLHMAVMHLDALLGLFNPSAGHPVDWPNVAARMKSVFFMATYVVLLGAALFHGLYGLRNILYELGPGPRARRLVNGILGAAGVALFLVGTWAAWAGYRLAQSL